MTRQVSAFLEHPRVLFFFAFFTFCTGIIIGSIEGWYLLIASVILALFLFFRFYTREWLIYGIFALFFLFSGHTLATLAHMDRYESLEKIEEITENFSGKYHISGKITHFLYSNAFTSTYRLKIDTIDTESTLYFFEKDQNVGISVSIPKNLTLHQGDTISFSAKIRPAFSEEKGGFGKYLWIRRIYGSVSLSTFTREKWTVINDFLSKNEKWTVIDRLLSVNENIQNILFRGFPRDIAGLLWGISIGNTALISDDMETVFKNSGLTHILVVSGSNIAFVILMFAFVLKYFPIHRYLQYSIILCFLLLYGTLVWWETPVIRATIMGILSFLAIRGWNQVHSMSLLFGIALIFLIINPLSLLYDASFGLSFGATFGILLCNNVLRRIIERFIPIWWIVTVMSVTLSATLGSMGMMIFHFGSVSILGIFANILVGGVMGILLILTTIYILLSFLPEDILYYFGYSIYYIASYVLGVARFFGNIPPYTLPPVLTNFLPIILYFSGFLALLHTTERTLISHRKADQNWAPHHE